MHPLYQPDGPVCFPAYSLPQAKKIQQILSSFILDGIFFLSAVNRDLSLRVKSYIFLDSSGDDKSNSLLRNINRYIKVPSGSLDEKFYKLISDPATFPVDNGSKVQEELVSTRSRLVQKVKEVQGRFFPEKVEELKKSFLAQLLSLEEEIQTFFQQSCWGVEIFTRKENSRDLLREICLLLEKKDEFPDFFRKMGVIEHLLFISDKSLPKEAEVALESSFLILDSLRKIIHRKEIEQVIKETPPTLALQMDLIGKVKECSQFFQKNQLQANGKPIPKELLVIQKGIEQEIQKELNDPLNLEIKGFLPLISNLGACTQEDLKKTTELLRAILKDKRCLRLEEELGRMSEKELSDGLEKRFNLLKALISCHFQELPKPKEWVKDKDISSRFLRFLLFLKKHKWVLFKNTTFPTHLQLQRTLFPFLDLIYSSKNISQELSDHLAELNKTTESLVNQLYLSILYQEKAPEIKSTTI